MSDENHKFAARLARVLFWRRPTRPGARRAPLAEEQPLRAELYSVDHLKRHAGAMAQAEVLDPSRSPDDLIPRLLDNERVLLQTYGLVTAAVAANRRISPAAEWLLDNFYLIEEQVRTARRHLPRSYGRQLPRLREGAHAGEPRVYAVALELISHVDGRLDSASLDAFVTAYQAVHPLTLGELWAVPIVLRLALIENLRRVAARVRRTRVDRDAASQWADRMVGVVERVPTNLILVLADMARADPPLSGAFLAELTRHLQGQSPYFGFATSWLEQRLSAEGFTIEQLVRADGHAQAADQVSIGNSITSLRFLSSTDWRDFVERHSVVEQTLREDPAHVYADMDFATRDCYRHGVEAAARLAALPEQDVARRAVELAQRPPKPEADGRTSHVGYYLVGRGHAELARVTKARRSVGRVIARIGHRWPLVWYLLVALVVATGVTAPFAAWAGHRAAGGIVLWLLVPVVACAVQIGVTVANALATAVVKPRPLPRLDFRKGIPDGHRTVVVVPSMLASRDGVEGLLAGLELRYLANRDRNLQFALLTDLEDAATEVCPADEGLVQVAALGIEQLNLRHARAGNAPGPGPFFLFHRARRWNAREGVWMGYERKRGKLAVCSQQHHEPVRQYDRRKTFAERVDIGADGTGLRPRKMTR